MRRVLTYLYQHGAWPTMNRMAQRLAMLSVQTLGREFVRTSFGVLMKANWSDRTFRLCYSGSYDRTLERLLRSQRREFVFLDIGANQGVFSLVAAQNPHCVAAIAFEPVGSTYDLLTANARANGVSGKIRAVKAGISSERGQRDIFVDPRHSGLASLTLNRKSQVRTELIELITMTEVDGMLPAQGDILVKIDVEGHEEVVIRQLVTSLHISRVSAVFYEVDERRVDPADLRIILEGAGFCSFSVSGQGKHYDVLARR